MQIRVRHLIQETGEVAVDVEVEPLRERDRIALERHCSPHLGSGAVVLEEDMASWEKAAAEGDAWTDNRLRRSGVVLYGRAFSWTDVGSGCFRWSGMLPENAVTWALLDELLQASCPDQVLLRLEQLAAEREFHVIAPAVAPDAARESRTGTDHRCAEARC